MTLLDYFQRAYVINLTERTDRRREVEAELARAKMPIAPGRVEVFPAVKPTTTAGFRSIGVHGCYRSHLGVLERALDERLENVLVMEDDVAFSPRLGREIPSLVRQLRSQAWGLLYVGHLLPLDDSGEVQLVRFSGPVRLLHCYAVNGPMIAPLVRFLQLVLTRPAGHPDGGPMDVDGAVSTFRAQHPDFTTLLAAPSLAMQRASRSDLSPKWFDALPAVRDVAAFARRMWWTVRPDR